MCGSQFEFVVTHFFRSSGCNLSANILSGGKNIQNMGGGGGDGRAPPLYPPLYSHDIYIEVSQPVGIILVSGIQRFRIKSRKKDRRSVSQR